MRLYKMITRSISASRSVHPILYYNPWHVFHFPGRMHPENQERINGIMEALDVYIKSDMFTLKTFTHTDFKEFDDDPETPLTDWVTVHGDNYRTKYTDSVLKISRNMIHAAVDDISKGNRCGYVLTRPPGHHASEGIESGFCFENNVWFAVEELLNQGKRKISIYDWDVHHGDGTERCLRSALTKNPVKYDGIRFVSTHAFGRGIYPGTGSLSKDKHIVNLPFKKGANADEFLSEFHTSVLPFLRDCEILVISAGYDGHRDDPMKLMKLETPVYSEMSRHFEELGVPVLFILEGGYDPKILGDCVRETLMQWIV